MSKGEKSASKFAYLPEHVAIIMDGNGRWAKRCGLPRLEGHRSGLGNVRNVVKYADEYQIKYLTLYGFSTENWNRPKDEVEGLFQLLEERIDEEARELHKNGVKILHIGRLKGLPQSTQRAISKAVKLTENNAGMVLGFAFNYGGRLELLDAIRHIIDDGISVDDVDERLVSNYLYTAGMPDVDLVIRTSGELRLSNFLVWQSSYSEYYFTKVLWPEFDGKELRRALLSYSRRKRRFGGL